jgi:hypothetical protein
MFHQAASRGIRARNQAMIRAGGEQGRAASYNAFQRVPRLVVFLGSIPHER